MLFCTSLPNFVGAVMTSYRFFCKNPTDPSSQTQAWPPTVLWILVSMLVPFSSYLTLNNIVTLKSGFKVIQGHWKWYHLIAWYGFLFSFYSTMAVSCIVSEIKRDIGRKSRFFSYRSTTPLGGFPSECSHNVLVWKKLEWCMAFRRWKTFDDIQSNPI